MNASLIEKNIAGFLATAIVMMTCMIPGSRAQAADPIGAAERAMKALRAALENDAEGLRRVNNQTLGAISEVNDVITRRSEGLDTTNLQTTATNLKNLGTSIKAEVEAANQSIAKVKDALMAVDNARAAESMIEGRQADVAIKLRELADAQVLRQDTQVARITRAWKVGDATRALAQARQALAQATANAGVQLGNMRDAVFTASDPIENPTGWRGLISGFRSSINALKVDLRNQMADLFNRVRALFALRNQGMMARMAAQMREAGAQAAAQARQTAAVLRVQARILADIARNYREQISAAIAAGYAWLQGTGTTIFAKSAARIATGSLQLAGAIVAGLAVGCEGLYIDYANYLTKIQIKCEAERQCEGRTRMARMAGIPPPLCNGKTLAEVTADKLATQRDAEAAVNSFNLACASTGLVDAIEMATLRCD